MRIFGYEWEYTHFRRCWFTELVRGPPRETVVEIYNAKMTASFLCVTDDLTRTMVNLLDQGRESKVARFIRSDGSCMLELILRSRLWILKNLLVKKKWSAGRVYVSKLFENQLQLWQWSTFRLRLALQPCSETNNRRFIKRGEKKISSAKDLVATCLHSLFALRVHFHKYNGNTALQDNRRFFLRLFFFLFPSFPLVNLFSMVSVFQQTNKFPPFTVPFDLYLPLRNYFWDRTFLIWKSLKRLECLHDQVVELWDASSINLHTISIICIVFCNKPKQTFSLCLMKNHRDHVCAHRKEKNKHKI